MIHSNTLDELVETTCKLYLNDWWEGLVTGTPAATTIEDDVNRFEDDDYFNNMELYMRDGDAAGDRRDINDFVNADNEFTVKASFSSTPSAGDSYSVHDKFKRDEVKEAINQSIEIAAERALVWVEDEATTLVASQYEYDIPTTFLWITRITMANSDGKFYDAPIPWDAYKIIHTPTAQLHFTQMPTNLRHDGHTLGNLWANSGFVAGRNLRIEGLGSPAKLTTDSSVCSINPEFICRQAAAILHSSRIISDDPSEHRAQFTICQRRADIELARIVSMQLPPDSKRVME